MGNGDGLRVVGVLLGVGVAGALIHRMFKAHEAQAATRHPIEPPPLPNQPVQEPEIVDHTSPAASPPPGSFASSIEAWRDEFERQAPDIPAGFAFAHMERESAGNACSWGFHGARDPNDGKFKFEAGIGQQYFEASTREALDQVRVHGVSLAELRAPCNGQQLARPLTPEERQKNVHVFVEDIREWMASADRQLAKAGVSWSKSSPDYWALVKLHHGLPCVVPSFLHAAAEAGQAETFDAFAAFVNGLARDRYTELTTACGCGKSMIPFFGKGTANALHNAIAVGHRAVSVGV